METKKVTLSMPSLEERLGKRIKIRNMSADEFVESHASGTLRKNKRIGMAWKSQYLHERVAYEFGYGFECIPRTRITVGNPITEEDSHSITEAGWHIERYQNMSIFPEDTYSCKYLQVEYPDSSRREGIGILVEQTSAPFIPEGHTVYSLIAEYDPQKHKWKEAINPF